MNLIKDLENQYLFEFSHCHSSPCTLYILLNSSTEFLPFLSIELEINENNDLRYYNSINSELIYQYVNKYSNKFGFLKNLDRNYLSEQQSLGLYRCWKFKFSHTYSAIAKLTLLAQESEDFIYRINETDRF